MGISPYIHKFEQLGESLLFCREYSSCMWPSHEHNMPELDKKIHEFGEWNMKEVYKVNLWLVYVF